MFNNLNFTSNDSFLGSNTNISSVNSGFDYNSFYRAIVKSNYDPDGLGRIRICIPALHSDVTSNNQYPWAYPGCFVGLGNQVGQFILPPIGSIVFVTFEYSDEHRPIYFGGIPTIYDEGKSQSYGRHILKGQSKEVTTDDIPLEYDGSQAIVYKSPTGAIIYFDDFSYCQKLVIKDSVGQTIQMKTLKDKSGNLIKQTEYLIDENNNILFEPDKLTVKLSGVSRTFTKDDLSGTSTEEGTTDCELIIW